MLKNNKISIPKVAIILVNYNGYEDTIKCLESLKKITYQCYSTYVVDNGSTNNSDVILEEYVTSDKEINARIIKSVENLGFSGGNNIGIKIALEEKAEYVLLLNNDTFVTPEFLDILVNNANNNKIVAPRIMYWKSDNTIWYGGGKLSTTLGRAWHDRINKEYVPQIDDLHKKVSFISGCCMLIHKDILDALGKLEEKYFLYYEDTEFCWRALNHGVELYYVGDAVIFHNVSSSIGHNSSLINYYKIRNRMYLIKEYVHGVNKLSANLCAYAELVIGLIIKKYQYIAVKEGLCDFRTGIVEKKKD